MPGPRNQKKKKAQKKKAQERKSLDDLHDCSTQDTLQQPQPSDSASPSAIDASVSAETQALTPELASIRADEGETEVPHSSPPPPEAVTAPATEWPSESPQHSHYSPSAQEHAEEPPIPPSLLKTPLIHDPGDGPRVKDTQAFLVSRFAAPPSLDDPLCAEFADEAVLQMLCTILPEETAMILWYNKSRRNARICPACHRLYRLGDVLPDHLVGEDARDQSTTQVSPYRAREQQLSGLCSPICFILASYNYPGAIRSTWGRMAEELDDETWDLLDAPGQRANDMGLGMLLKMTRCHDLGLGQLFFPDMEFDSDATCNEPDSEREEDMKEKKWVKEGSADREDRAEEEVTVKMATVALDSVVSSPSVLAARPSPPRTSGAFRARLQGL